MATGENGTANAKPKKSQDKITTLHSALINDCEEFITKLEDKPNIDYDTFAEVWQDMSFSLIYCAPRSFEEMLSFTEELLSVVKTLWLSKVDTWQRRLSTLYLMYGVYMKQPIKNGGKIRVTSEDWIDIEIFFGVVRHFELNEIHFLLCKLIQAEAFRFCGYPTDLHLDKRCSKHDLTPLTFRNKGADLMDSKAATITTETNINNILEKGLFDKISSFEKKYNSTKIFYGVPKVTEVRNTVQQDLGEMLKHLCIEALDLEVSTEKKSENESTSNEQSSVAEPVKQAEESIGERRRRLKHLLLEPKVKEKTTAAVEVPQEAESKKTKKPKRRRRFKHMGADSSDEELVTARIKKRYRNVHSKNSRNLYTQLNKHQDESDSHESEFDDLDTNVSLAFGSKDSTTSKPSTAGRGRRSCKAARTGRPGRPCKNLNPDTSVKTSDKKKRERACKRSMPLV